MAGLREVDVFSSFSDAAGVWLSGRSELGVAPVDGAAGLLRENIIDFSLGLGSLPRPGARLPAKLAPVRQSINFLKRMTSLLVNPHPLAGNLTKLRGQQKLI